MVIYPGDIFDRWNPPPEIINFALENIPFGYAIPGQHDLPLHNYQNIDKSAYWTLVRGGAIVNLVPGIKTGVKNWTGVYLYGFPWKFDILPCTANYKDQVHVAVCHKYVWHENAKYPDAPNEAWVGNGKLKKALAGYSCAFFGDNHKGFATTLKNGSGGYVPVVNCGGFMRRKSDEVDYQPTYGLIWSDGSVSRGTYKDYPDKWVSEDLIKSFKKDGEIEALVEMLEDIGDVSLDFGESLRRYMDKKKVAKGVRELIAHCLGD